jgi:hypothetical protein
MSDDDGDAFGSSQNAMSQDEFGGSDEDFGGIEDDDDAFGGMLSQSDSPQKASACKKESKLAVLQAQDPSHVNAKVLSKADLEKHERAEIQDTAGMLDITQGDAVALLVAHRWKKDALVDAFLGDDEKVKKDAGLAPEEPAKDEGPLPDRFAVRGAAPVPAPEPEVTTPKRKRAKKGAAPAKKTKKRATRKSTRRGGTGAASDDNEMDEDDTSAVASVTESVASASPVETPQPSYPPCVTPSPSNFECQICFCVDGPGQPSVKLACGHRFCLDCVKTLLGTCLMSDSLLGNLRCMEVGCKVMLGDEVVRALATPEQIARWVSRLCFSKMLSRRRLTSLYRLSFQLRISSLRLLCLLRPSPSLLPVPNLRPNPLGHHSPAFERHQPCPSAHRNLHLRHLLLLRLRFRRRPLSRSLHAVEDVAEEEGRRDGERAVAADQHQGVRQVPFAD